jgi:hypothetical protein
LSFFEGGSEFDILNLENLSKVSPLLPPELPALIAERHRLDNIGRMMFVAAFNEAFERELESASTYEEKLALLPYLSERMDKSRLLADVVPYITEASECQRIYNEVLSDLDDVHKLPLKEAWNKLAQAEIDRAVNLSDLFKALESAPEEMRFSEKGKIFDIGYSSPFSHNLT